MTTPTAPASTPNEFQVIWDEIKTWVSHEWTVLSTAEMTLLKSEIPTLTSAGAKALQDFIVQAATSFESQGLAGATKASLLGTEIVNALGAGLQVVDGGPAVQAGSISQRLLNALVDAGAVAAKIGVTALIASM